VTRSYVRRVVDGDTKGEIVRIFLLTACAALCLAVAVPSFATAKPTPRAAKKKKKPCKPKAETSGCKLKQALYSRPDNQGTVIHLTVSKYLGPVKAEVFRWCHARDGNPVPFHFQSNAVPTIGRTLTLANVGTTVPGDPGTYAGSATVKFAAKSVTVTFATTVSYDGEVKCSLNDHVTLKRVS